MIDIIAFIILVIVLAAAGGYVYNAKKNGQKCIGCPDSRACSAKTNASSCSGCSSSCGGGSHLAK